MGKRIHITGASGSGTSTLGQALSSETRIPAFDSDQFFWQPTESPFTTKREAVARESLLHATLGEKTDWILSGSIYGWQSTIEGDFTHVIFLHLQRELRMERLRKRELERYGAEALAPGGVRYEAEQDFLNWASYYDDGSLPGRNRAKHEAWLITLACPVLRLDSQEPLAALVTKARAFISA